MKIPFSPPFINEYVRKEIDEVLDSGWITTGPKVKELEDLFCDKFDIPTCLGVNSWTSGAILTLKWWGIGPGDEVIIPAYTYAATALSVLHVGATPVIVDVRDDFNIDPEALENVINNKTKAIIPVDFAGLPCDYDAIYQIVEKESVKAKFQPSSEKQHLLNRILVFADAAHSVGATYNGKLVGGLADITGFSLHAVKNITSAEGGIIGLNLPEPFNNKELYPLIRRYALNGQTKDAFTKTQAGAWRYDIVEMGMKCNLPDLNAALALGQLKQYDNLLLERKRIHNLYDSLFESYEWAEIPIGIDEKRESSYHVFPLRIKNITEEQRDKIIEIVSLTGVSVNVHFVPLPALTLFKNLGFKIEAVPISYNLYSREISLPIYPQLTDVQVNFVVSSIADAFSKV